MIVQDLILEEADTTADNREPVRAVKGKYPIILEEHEKARFRLLHQSSKGATDTDIAHGSQNSYVRHLRGDIFYFIFVVSARPIPILHMAPGFVRAPRQSSEFARNVFLKRPEIVSKET